MTLTTYDPATGELKEVRTGMSMDAIAPLIGDAPFVEGAWSPKFYRVDLESGQVTEKDG